MNLASRLESEQNRAANVEQMLRSERKKNTRLRPRWLAVGYCSGTVFLLIFKYCSSVTSLARVAKLRTS